MHGRVHCGIRMPIGFDVSDCIALLPWPVQSGRLRELLELQCWIRLSWPRVSNTDAQCLLPWEVQLGWLGDVCKLQRGVCMPGDGSNQRYRHAVLAWLVQLEWLE